MNRSSAQRKLARGIEQVKALCGDADAFNHDNAYTFEKEIESRTAQEIKYRCFAIERKPVPDDWPLRSGEAIQNLRSSLDHLIYQASKRGRSQFPIFTDTCEFQVRGTPMLRGIPASMRAAIERSQPYIRTPDAPAEDALERLRTLSNADKHRSLATVATSVQNEGVGVPDGAEIRWEEYATNKVLGAGKTYISTISHGSPGKPSGSSPNASPARSSRHSRRTRSSCRNSAGGMRDSRQRINLHPMHL